MRIILVFGRTAVLFLAWLGVLTPLFCDKYISINLSKQELCAFDNETIFMCANISSGKRGYETPVGVFGIIEKERKHVSNLYPVKKNGRRGGAKMPYMLKFKQTGEAIHAGYVPGFPASHGCVRLKYHDAKKLYGWANIGTSVEIFNKDNTSFVLPSLDEDTYFDKDGFFDGIRIDN